MGIRHCLDFLNNNTLTLKYNFGKKTSGGFIGNKSMRAVVSIVKQFPKLYKMYCVKIKLKLSCSPQCTTVTNIN